MVLRLQYEKVEAEHQKTLKGLEPLNRAHKTLIRVFGSNAPMLCVAFGIPYIGH